MFGFATNSVEGIGKRLTCGGNGEPLLAPFLNGHKKVPPVNLLKRIRSVLL